MVLDFSATASKYAWQRSRQRGIPTAVVNLVLGNFDTALHAGNGCQAVRLSRQAIADLHESGVNQQLLDRASRIVAVLREDSLKVVTVLHDYGSDRRYRHQTFTRKSGLKWGA